MGRLRTFFARSRSPGGRWLAALPVGLALALAAVVLPRSAPPEDVPLPSPDVAALRARALRDHSLAERARRFGLPDDLRILGQALRDFHALEARDAAPADVLRARAAIEAARAPALDAAGLEGLAQLRAVQLESFLVEVRRLEATGAESDELRQVAGAFARRMQVEGWVQGGRFAPGDAARRAMFKQMWNATLGVDPAKDRPPLALTLDEQRALYAFLLGHPRADQAARRAFDVARQSAKDARACEALDAGERIAAEKWRLKQIDRFAELDGTYPADFARGVSQYRAGTFEAAAESFRRWLVAHPSGPLTLRAENHLRASVLAARSR